MRAVNEIWHVDIKRIQWKLVLMIINMVIIIINETGLVYSWWEIKIKQEKSNK